MTRHEPYIRECYALAAGAARNGNHPFGALLVRDAEIVLTAENTVNTDADCTRHAELNLVSRAVRRFAAAELADAVLYASTEPCAMCAGAIYWSGISAVVYGVSARALGRITDGSFVAPCREILAFGRRHVQVVGPVLEQEGVPSHRKFWRRTE